jgi:hypothetical protein
MAKQGDREPETEPRPPSELRTGGDRFLYREMTKKIGEMESHMSEIVKIVNAVPVSIDARVEPVNRQLATIVSTIESHSKTVEIVESIRKTANKYLWLAVLAPFGSVGIIRRYRE